MNTNSVAHYNELIKALEGLVKVYSGLLKTVMQEKEILISTELDDLIENNKTKEAMLIQIKKLETARAQIVESIAKEEKLPEDQRRLLDLSIHFGGPHGDKLRNYHSVLELLIKRVKEFNMKNEALVHSALSRITGTMDAIRDTLKEKSTYQQKGAMADAPAPSGQLVSREA